MDKKILDHFKKVDPILYAYAIKVSLRPIVKITPNKYFHRLCHEIICQQLSDKAGDTIFGRFEKNFPKGFAQPKDVLKISIETLRKTGMSYPKAGYIKNLAEIIIEGTVNISQLDSLSDNEVVKELTKIKGIGPWTAEMFLMFTLARENIFSAGDLGLKKGITKIYGSKLSQKKMEKIISKWSPYKTYGSRILWASLTMG